MRHYRQELQKQLAALQMNIQYTRAKGDYLYYKKEGKTVEVLDMVGSYGANLLGHHHDELIQTATDFFQKHQPFFVQGTISNEVERLSQQLRKIFGDYTVILTNTGAETVEAAFKHSFLENGRSRCWALTNGFHGKSLGTLPFSKTHSAFFQKNKIEIDFLDPNDEQTWEKALKNVCDVSCVIVEPIQGEGGILMLNNDFVDWLNETTAKYKIPIIVDEIQTGLGRTGKMLMSDSLGLRRDYICLSKALGGGMAKIGALLVRDKRFLPSFSMLHTSTFGDDGWSAAIANKVLEIIQQEQIAKKCASIGKVLKQRLQKLQERFPTVIEEIRGEGLMLGIEFSLQSASSSNLLRTLSASTYFGYIIAGFLLYHHRIRVMPTLSNPNTLRLQPSVFIQKTQIQQLIDGLYAVCEIIEKADAGNLLGYIVGREVATVKDYRGAETFKNEKVETSKKVAFIGHFIEAQDLAVWDASLEDWTVEELEMLIDKVAEFLYPVTLDQVNVRAVNGALVHFRFIGIFWDSRIIEKSYRSRSFSWMVQKIQEAIYVAEEAGCQVAGLGGYTSILAKNGKRVHAQKLKITTGNSLTVGIGFKAIEEAVTLKKICLEESSIAIVGAGGNIANTYATLLAGKKVKRIILIPRKLENRAVQKLETDLLKKYPTTKIEITDQISAVQDCEIIIASSNTSQPLIFPKHLASTNQIICDLAVPSDLDESVSIAFPDILQIKGGIIELPNGNDFSVSGVPLPRNHAFACMSETLLMGLDECKHFEGSIGAVEVKDVWKTLELAKKYGFELGALKLMASY